jgi:hypothetical protein
MATLKILNRARNTVLATQADIADTSRKRRVGLLKHTSLPPGQGLWIAPCEGIHTFGMKFAIDVLFLDRKKKVLKARPEMKAARLSLCLLAESVLELPPGTIKETGTQAGDVLEFERTD